MFKIPRKGIACVEVMNTNELDMYSCDFLLIILVELQAAGTGLANSLKCRSLILFTLHFYGCRLLFLLFWHILCSRLKMLTGGMITFAINLHSFWMWVVMMAAVYHRIIMITMAGRVMITCRTKSLKYCWQLRVFHVLFFSRDGWICISTHLQMLFEIFIRTGHFSWRPPPMSMLKLFPLLLQLFTITMGWWIVSRSFQIWGAPKDESRDVRNISSLL